MKNQIEKHPIISSLILSIIASAVYKLFFEPLIGKYQQLKFLIITLNLTLPNDKIVSFSTNLITILFYLIVIIFLTTVVTHFITKSRTRKRIQSTLPDDTFCKDCNDIVDLKQKNAEKQEKYDKLLSEYQTALPYKKLTDCLSNFFDNTEVLESLQLFSVPRLPSIDEVDSLDEVCIPLHFVDGKAKEHSNTNALFNVNYTFEKSIYYDLKKLFDSRNNYYLTSSKQRNPYTEKNIQEDAIKLFQKIKESLDSINDISEIQNTHYACYKLMEILANVVIGETSIINCDKMLESPKIEAQLRFGQRTGMLGAIFTENLYCFYNENSMTKKDRMYFSVPISYKNTQFILLGICNKNDLKVTTNCDYVKCCEQIYEQVNESLKVMGGME